MKRIGWIISFVCCLLLETQLQAAGPQMIEVFDSQTGHSTAFPVDEELTSLDGQAPLTHQMEDSLHIASVINGEDWHQVNGHEYPYSAVVYLDRTRKTINGNRVSDGGCSAAMIGDYTVLTAAHCVYKNINVNIEGLYKPEDIIAYAGGSKSSIHAKGTRIYVAPGTINLSWEDRFITMDYAIVVLDKPIGKKSGTLGAKTVEFKTGQPVTTIGFPGEKDHVKPWLSSGKILEVREGWIEFDADTLPGNSGGPVFVNNDLNNLVAVTSFENIEYNGASTPANNALLSFINEFRDAKPSAAKPYKRRPTR